jgi:hypothetical protein
MPLPLRYYTSSRGDAVQLGTLTVLVLATGNAVLYGAATTSAKPPYPH